MAKKSWLEREKRKRETVKKFVSISLAFCFAPDAFR